MTDKQPTPLPDYFALLRSMLGANTTAPSNLAVPSLGALAAVDPAEIDKKIRELEIVHMWLQAQANAVELSIKGMQYQRDMLMQLATARENAETTFSKEEMAKFVGAFNPSQWMSQMMPKSTPAPKAAARRAVRKKPRAAKKT
jgi:hypothetical protein